MAGSKGLLDKKFSGSMNIKARSAFVSGQGDEGEDGGWKGQAPESGGRPGSGWAWQWALGKLLAVCEVRAWLSHLKPGQPLGK